MEFTMYRRWLEEDVSRAHRAVFKAHNAAQLAQMDGAAADLEQILAELTRVGESLLRRRYQHPTLPGLASVREAS
jgi:hypothetical protein